MHADQYADQYTEHLAHSAPCASRWDGYKGVA